MENPMNKWMIWGENPLFSETPIWAHAKNLGNLPTYQPSAIFRYPALVSSHPPKRHAPDPHGGCPYRGIQAGHKKQRGIHHTSLVLAFWHFSKAQSSCFCRWWLVIPGKMNMEHNNWWRFGLDLDDFPLLSGGFIASMLWIFRGATLYVSLF